MDCKKVRYCCDWLKAGPEVFWSLNDCRQSCFYNEDRKNSLPKCNGDVSFCKMPCPPEQEFTYYFYEPREHKCVSTKNCCPLSNNVFMDMSSCRRICLTKEMIINPLGPLGAARSKSDSKESKQEKSSEE